MGFLHPYERIPALGCSIRVFQIKKKLTARQLTVYSLAWAQVGPESKSMLGISNN